jgi:ATP-dependent Zn protease
MPSKTKSETSRALAHHEAGHAVMAFRLGRGATKVSIIKDEVSLGRLIPTKLTSFHPDIETDRRTRWRVEQSIRIYLAGPIAEEIYTGKTNIVGASSDNGSAADLALSWCGPEDVASAFLRWLHLDTAAELNVPFVWAAVEALAEELLEKNEIGWRAARRVMNTAMMRHA